MLYMLYPVKQTPQTSLAEHVWQLTTAQDNGAHVPLTNL